MPKLNSFFFKLAKRGTAPVIRALRRRLGTGYFEHPELQLPPPWDMVQLLVERQLDHYLHVAETSISEIAIVGAHDGAEISRLIGQYPNVHINAFEPSQAAFSKLQSRFGSNRSVSLFNIAVSDRIGEALFYELPLEGNGSLLKPLESRWREINKQPVSSTSSSIVSTSTLDTLLADIPKLDLLWIDVQGAELSVLSGGVNVLNRTTAIFLEVSIPDSPYSQGCKFDNLDQHLQSKNFRCISLGLDPWNYTGNAFFVRSPEQLACQPHR